MMTEPHEKYFLAKAEVTRWLDALTGRAVVFAPMRDGGGVVFRAYAPGREVILDRVPATPPKAAVFPQNEELLRYRYEKDPENPGRTELNLRETLPDRAAVVVGARPCGAKGARIFDPVYDPESGEPGMRDPYYAARRAQTLHVTVACTRAESTCFCRDVGGDPADPEGSDVLLTPVSGGFVAEAVTGRGAGLLDERFFTPAGERAAEADAAIERTRAALPEAHDYAGVPEALMAVFDDLDFWREQSAKCISCGACTYLCPTCYCFNVTDESSGLTGKRLRTWDNCMSFQFTLEGSGHNPRPTKAHRLRNRIGHKFAYYPRLHGGIIACCGCGRCIKSCPTGVDIRAIVQAAQERAVRKLAETTTEAGQ